MTTTEMDTVCPFCLCQHECATGPFGGVPDDGDVTICFMCGQFSMFDHTATGGLRKPTKKESREIERSQLAEQVHGAWKIVKPSH